MSKPSLLFLAVTSITLVLIFSFATFSYGQFISTLNQFPPGDNDVFIFVQIIVYNTDGQIVTYLTSAKFTILNWGGIFALIDSEVNENDPIVTIDGKKYQVITRSIEEIQGFDSVTASTLLGYATENTSNRLLQSVHDGFHFLKGEKVTSIWTFVIPVI